MPFEGRLEGRISRRHVAALLGVSQAYVCLYLDGKHLHPERIAGRVWYEDREVRALKASGGVARRRRRASTRRLSRIERREAGETAARVFSLLTLGKSLQAIVIETRTDPETVRRLWREWRTSFADGERQRQSDAATAEAEKAQREERRHEMRLEWARAKKAMRAKEVKENREEKDDGHHG